MQDRLAAALLAPVTAAARVHLKLYRAVCVRNSDDVAGVAAVLVVVVHMALSWELGVAVMVVAGRAAVAAGSAVVWVGFAGGVPGGFADRDGLIGHIWAGLLVCDGNNGWGWIFGFATHRPGYVWVC